ncbi:glycoside hydrolase family 7 protein [Phanerochaete carnosa HHB-10118-sp]|uniref:cellulose 1,4-beta-cellobiosidase (non-reducing end) n=1 Tax=Phanerochaete carnosa (strain HHB-10118-sp) TaxID=650164 RepID=K5WI89_PHACS|nr:glycoside hydrolase family 7 protein [Phanerochaete carnosa HHB-10118-sp]EKM59090.1 glycoside hydrolase family 7 protein [Phanerochaete carnosa HHB-10118-sp]
MFHKLALISFTLAAIAAAQQAGTQTPETHPTLSSQKCTTAGGTTGYTNCYTGNEWDATLCPDGATCAANCALDGADYTGTYGITSSESSLTLQFETGSNVGSRVDAAAFTPHPCTTDGQTQCSGDDCTRDTGLCDADGCDFNSFRLGDKTFLGNGLTVDTSKPFTVVTQFVTSDNTTTGTLSEIRRVYVQGGKVIQNSVVNIPGIDAVNSITDEFCTEQKTVFGDTDYFSQHGGLQQMGESLGNGMVLTLSVWDDYAASMLWLDSNYPTTKDGSSPGVSRGTCATTSGVPAQIESQAPSSKVVFSNIKFGDIGCTFSGGTTSLPPPPPPASGSGSSAGPAPTGSVAQWGQCGGTGYSGPTVITVAEYR